MPGYTIGWMKKQPTLKVQSLIKRKKRLLRAIEVPIDALPGSLSMSRFRCGKANCHCQNDEGHESWTLTYMSQGAKRVKHIPADFVDQVRQQVERGKDFKEAINQIFVTNAELLVLLRKQRR